MGSNLLNKEGFEIAAQVFSFVDPVVSKFTAEPYLQMSAAQAASDAAEDEAKLARSEAKLSAESLRRENQIRTSMEQLAFIRSGVYASSGSPLEVLSSNALQREVAALNVELRGFNEYNALQAQSKNILTTARFAVGKQTVQAAKQVVGTIYGSVLGGGAGAFAGNAIGGQGAGDLGAGARTLFARPVAPSGASVN